MNNEEKRNSAFQPLKPSKNMKIDHIIIENFKCFRVRQTVGPFSKITGIIGGNGSGKSTVLEAFGFVLGKDLILKNKVYKYANLSSHKELKAKKSVQVQMILTDNNEENITFKRELKQDDTFEFIIDKTVVSIDEYFQKLRENNLFGFLIMGQDDLQTFTSKSPCELTALFEKISGSEEYKKPYDKLEKELQKLNTEIIEKNEKLRHLKRDKKYSKLMVQSGESVNEFYRQMDEIEKEIFDLTLLDYHMSIQSDQINIERIRTQIHETKQTIDKVSSQIIENNLQYKHTKTAKTLFDQKIKYQNIESEIAFDNKNIKNVEMKIFEVQKSIDDLSKLVFNQKNLLEKRKKDIQECDDSIHNAEKEIKKINDLKTTKFAKIGSGNKNYDAFVFDLNKMENELESICDLLKKETSDFEILKKKWIDANNEKKECEKKLDFEAIGLRKMIEDKNSIEKKLKTLENEIEQKEKNISRLSDPMSDKINLETELQMLKNKAEEVRSRIKVEKQEAPLTKAIISSVEGVYGDLSSLIEVTNSRFALPIGVALLKIFDNLVVSNASAAAKTSEFLKSKYMTRNLVILESAKYNSDQIHQNHTELRATIGAKGHLAVDAISVSKNVPHLKEFISFFLKGVIICDNMKTAFQLAKQLGNQAKKYVTLDGTVLKNGDIEDLGVESQYPKKLMQFIDKFKRQNKNPIEKEVVVHEELSDLLVEKQEIDNKIFEIEKRLKNIQMPTNDHFYDENKKEQLFKSLKKEFFSLECQIQISNHKIDTSQKKLQKMIDEENKLNDQKEEVEKIKIGIEEKKFSLSRKMEDVKKDFYHKNQVLFKSMIEFENVILASKDADYQISKISSKINELKIQKSLLSMDSILKQIDLLEQNQASTTKLFEDFENERIEVMNKIEKSEIEKNNIQKNIVTLELEAINREQSLSKLTANVKELEEFIGKMNGDYRTLVENVEKIKMDRQNYIEEQELRGFPVSSDLKKNIMKRSKKIDPFGSLNVNNKDDFMDDMIYDFTEVLKSYDKSSINEFEKEEVKSNLEEKSKLLADIKKKLKEMTTNIQNEHLLNAEKDKIERITNSLKDLQDQIGVLFEREKQVKEKLEETSSIRKSKLLNLLEMLQTRISFFYKRIYMDERAVANFMLENNVLPFAEGILFSATPPTKKFTIGTESLSSGESSLANLALFLCLNEVMKSSIVFFDEIDSHLDTENVFRFINVVGKFSRFIQTCFVSHKVYVFSKAEVLLGITKDLKTESAKCLSLKLAMPKAVSSH